jgi:uncharacterized protein with ParB-like and HNH nuclease domain
MASNQHNTMTSGNYYSLANLFSGEKKIIIPDLQRDYCWGDETHTDKKIDLVNDFLINLKSSFGDFQILEEKKKNEYELTLGLIYAYENPKNHIQLCDGQQRLTTLYLLLGMLNKKCENNPFQEHLMSDFEGNDDDKEPYLLYSIRESTLYFLSDLVVNFFLKEENKVEDIKKQDWYFKDYDLDPSIQSMLTALKIIEERIDNVECENFGNFLLHNLKFLYYDIQNRQMGEETFVIINTTGEPLTATENLKPILIGKITDDKEMENESNLWEDRETWFWRNRKEDEYEADNGLNDFLTWVIKATQQKESVEKENLIKEFKNGKIKDELSLINEYFEALKILIDVAISNENKKIRDIFYSVEKFTEQNKNSLIPLYLTKLKNNNMNL